MIGVDGRPFLGGVVILGFFFWMSFLGVTTVSVRVDALGKDIGR